MERQPGGWCKDPVKASRTPQISMSIAQAHNGYGELDRGNVERLHALRIGGQATTVAQFGSGATLTP